MPPAAVPPRLRAAVAQRLKGWGYGWSDISFAGTVEVPAGEHWPLGPGALEVWVFAVTAAPLEVGDEIASTGGRSAGIGVSGFSGGVIPVTPFQAHVYEYLGRRGGDQQGTDPAPPGVPRAPDMERAGPDRRR